MDRIIEQLGNISVVVVRLREARTKRVELEKIPQPKKEIFSKSWLQEKLAGIEQEKRDMAKALVQSAAADVASVFSEENFKEAILKRLSAMPIERRILLFPFISELLEENLYSISLDSWGKRTSDVDRTIRGYESRLPPKFSMELVNKHKDFPAERIVFENNEACDKWLSEILGSKKPIPFNPFEKWLEKLEQAYAVYLEEHRKEEEAKKPPPVEVPVQPESSDEIPQSVLQAEFYDLNREKSPGTLRDRVSRIYKGGTK